MNRIGRAWRNQAHVEHRSGRPRVALVDCIAMLVQLERFVKVSAGLERSFAFTAGLIVSHSAPVESVAFFIFTLQLGPDVKRVYRSARKEMTYVARPYDDVDGDCFSSPHGRALFRKWRDQLAWIGDRSAGRDRSHGLLAVGEGAGNGSFFNLPPAHGFGLLDL